MIRFAVLAAVAACLAGPADAAQPAKVLENGIAPAEACRLIFIYADAGDRLAFQQNNAMPAVTEKCNRARSHDLGLVENDCQVTLFLLRMINRSVPELTCAGK